MPASWQGWVSTIALDHIEFDVMGRGTFLHFITLFREQNQIYQRPPPDVYPSVRYFLSTVRQFFDARLNEQEIVVPPPVVVEEPAAPDVVPNVVPDSGHDESVSSNQVVIEPVVDGPPDDNVYQEFEDSPFVSIMDFYGQPFALDPTPLQAIPYDPTSDMFADPPPIGTAVVDPSTELPLHLELLPSDAEAGPSRPSGVSRSYQYELGLVKTTGRGEFQPLSLDQIPFVTDPYILHPEKEIPSMYPSIPCVDPPVDDYLEDEIEPLEFARREESTPEEEEYGSDEAVDGGKDIERDVDGGDEDRSQQ